MQNENGKLKFLQIPNDRHVLEKRDVMLQECLRSDMELEFGICEEYPLVLNHNDTAFSFGLLDTDGTVASHINFLPRVCLQQNGEDIKLGFIGNVATQNQFRHQGLMKRLLNEAEELAKQQGCQALVLWSDLDLFYQKLGFSSVGKEWRFVLDKIPDFSKTDLFRVAPEDLNEESYRHYLSLRPKSNFEIIRTFEDAVKLLTIPETCWITNKDKTAYFIIGKGADMQGVVHEWGFSSFEDWKNMLFVFLSIVQLEECLILSPTSKNEKVDNILTLSSKSSMHSMAWLKPVGEGAVKLPDDFFIWGLDSI